MRADDLERLQKEANRLGHAVIPIYALREYIGMIEKAETAELMDTYHCTPEWWRLTELRKRMQRIIQEALGLSNS